MASAMRNLIGTRVEKGEYNVVLTMVWNEAGTHWRSLAGQTYLVAAAISEASRNERWCIEVDAGCSLLGGTHVATTIRLELAEGDAGEMARAEALLRKVAQDIKG